MSKSLSRWLRDFFTGFPNIYSASADDEQGRDESIILRREMAKRSSHNGGTNNKKADGSSAVLKPAKKNSACGVAYSQRTPRQLHASTYMYKPS